MRLHDFIPSSRANGPGLRAVLWLQGCSRRCPGCCNPATHPPQGGISMGVADLWRGLKPLSGALEGLTLSGGEPLEQLQGLLALLQGVRLESRLSVILFTGWTFEEVGALPQADSLLSCVDLLIAGPYDPRRHLASRLRGSSNQTLHFLTDRYCAADLERVPEAEVLITPAGEVLCTGVDGARPAAGLAPHPGEGGAP